MVACLLPWGRGYGAEKGGNAAPPKAEWHETVSSGVPGSFPLIDPCELRFNLSWNGVIKAGEVVSQVGDLNPENASQLTARASASSSGLARLFWTYDVDYEAVIEADRLEPIDLAMFEDYGDELVQMTVEYEDDRARSIATTTKKDDGTVTTSKRVFWFDRVYDLYSAVLYVRSLPLADGDTVTLLIYPIHSPYLVTFTVLGREKHPFQDTDIDCIKLGLDIKKVNKDHTLKDYKKFESAAIWISDDSLRLPVEIRTQIFVGSIRATLTSHEPLAAKAKAASTASGGSTTTSAASVRKAADAPKSQSAEAEQDGEAASGGGERGSSSLWKSIGDRFRSTRDRDRGR